MHGDHNRLPEPARLSFRMVDALVSGTTGLPIPLGTAGRAWRSFQ